MKRSSQASHAKLFAIAESQGGFFTPKQAEEAGFDRTNHSYHVRAGNWEREHRGIYRLMRFPAQERPDLIRWFLWSRDRGDHPLGVYSYQTALSIYDLSDLMPAKLHMTVPLSFRKSVETPKVLVLHYADLAKDEIVERDGYKLTRPIRAIVDLNDAGMVSDDILIQAFSQGKSRGIITQMDIEKYHDKLPKLLLKNAKRPLKIS